MVLTIELAILFMQPRYFLNSEQIRIKLLPQTNLMSEFQTPVSPPVGDMITSSPWGGFLV